ncbi:hypothetical protein D3C76_1305600 [compost metagenome]
MIAIEVGLNEVEIDVTGVSHTICCVDQPSGGQRVNTRTEDIAQCKVPHDLDPVLGDRKRRTTMRVLDAVA